MGRCGLLFYLFDYVEACHNSDRIHLRSQASACDRDVGLALAEEGGKLVLDGRLWLCSNDGLL